MNIARFDPKATAAAVLEASHAAGAHELILSLSDGYSTKIGEAGMALSAGQRQCIGLARAFYGKPFLVVLDEPSSNLDAEGEEALTEAILNVRRRRGIVAVVAHRPKALQGVWTMCCAVPREARVQSFGKREEVLNRVLRNPVPLKVVREGHGAADDQPRDTGHGIHPALHDCRHDHVWHRGVRYRRLGDNDPIVGRRDRPGRGRGGFERQEGSARHRRHCRRAARAGGRPGQCR